MPTDAISAAAFYGVMLVLPIATLVFMLMRNGRRKRHRETLAWLSAQAEVVREVGDKARITSTSSSYRVEAISADADVVLRAEVDGDATMILTVDLLGLPLSRWTIDDEHVEVGGLSLDRPIRKDIDALRSTMPGSKILINDAGLSVAWREHVDDWHSTTVPDAPAALATRVRYARTALLALRLRILEHVQHAGLSQVELGAFRAGAVPLVRVEPASADVVEAVIEDENTATTKRR